MPVRTHDAAHRIPRPAHPPAALTLTLLLILAAAWTPGRAAAQDEHLGGPFKVLVPALAPRGGADDKFGEETAKQIRKLFEGVPTHDAVAPEQLKADLKRFSIKAENLRDCVTARQFASRLKLPLLMCGTYEPAGSGMHVSVQVVSPTTGDAYEVAPFTANAPEEAAQHVIADFRHYVDQLRLASFCHDYASSQQWNEALRTCNRAIEINPRSVSLQYQRARILLELDSLAAAAASFQKVLDLQPQHRDAMLSLGITLAKLGQKDASLEAFRKYLELEPGNVDVRLRIATDAANAGNNEAALTLLEEGMHGDSVGKPLLEYAGHFAMNAANQKLEDADTTAARALLDKAVGYYQRATRGDPTKADPLVLRNMLLADRLLGHDEDALALGGRAVAAHPDDGALLSAYADVLVDAGKVDDGLAMLDRAAKADSTVARVNARKGTWLVQAGRLDDARPLLEAAIRQHELDNPDVLARSIFATGYNKFGKPGNFAAAMPYYKLARQFATTPETGALIDFFHGYALMKQGIEVQKPNTVASAKAALPVLQEARKLLDGAAAYRAQADTRTQLIKQLDTFIEIQNAIIKRGR